VTEAALVRQPRTPFCRTLVLLLPLMSLAGCDRPAEHYFYALNAGRVVGPFVTAESCEAIRAEVDPRHGASSCWRGR
jgi:hypothetical protein